ncbi:Uncharacterised protein [Vibrio cholerae]|nr:Uncharacterised protein [Vibrio cholerae]
MLNAMTPWCGLLLKMMNSSKWISGSIYSLAGKVGRRVLRSLAAHSIEVMSRQKKRG